MKITVKPILFQLSSADENKNQYNELKFGTHYLWGQNENVIFLSTNQQKLTATELS